MATGLFLPAGHLAAVSALTGVHSLYELQENPASVPTCLFSEGYAPAKPRNEKAWNPRNRNPGNSQGVARELPASQAAQRITGPRERAGVGARSREKSNLGTF